MRLWHENLIKQLPRQQLLGQHRECCALRGKGWGKPHATVNYVFDHSPFKLYQYHKLVMTEMLSRDYQPDPLWLEPLYRGKHTLPYTTLEPIVPTHPLYPEHNETYLADCLENLRQKNIFIDHVI
ncbi:MAG: TIGR02328 family protein [Leuconostoc carnosum]|uniref:TIGR02328 family protein n=1 Tax=Leuconostoc carnosum TaxID=1252 RepID=UPI003F9B234C